MGAATRTQEALQAFNQAISLCPTFGEAFMNRGLALEILGRDSEAFAAYASASYLTPLYLEADIRLAELAARTNLQPPLSAWPAQRASILARIAGRFRRTKPPASEKGVTSLPTSETGLRQMLERDHANFSCSAELGAMFSRQGRLVEAEHFLRFTLRHDPSSARAAVSLAELLERLGRQSEAVVILLLAMKASADDVRLLPLLLRLKQAVCDWENYDAIVAKAIAAIRQTPGCTEPFPAFVISPEPRDHLACAQAYATVLIQNAKPLPPRRRARNQKTLTIGYMSSDFHQHAGATLFAELFGLHDRSKFRIIGYALWTDDGSILRQRIRTGCDRFIDMWGISARDAAMRIAADNVDILVDLTGYASNGRPDILAHRPSPIQINYLGYPGTMGAPFMDYAIVDPVIAPAGDEPWFTEKLIRLPNVYQINDRNRPRPKPRGHRRDHGLPETGVVFCNFNGNSKFTPAFFDAWMRILRGVSNSVLWLYAGSAESIANLRREATRRGVDPACLIFARNVPYVDHIARYAMADLFLDTLPYTAHTTASEALWMACPLITCLGTAFPGRVAASLLHATGLEELVTASLDDYEALAVRLGNDAARLAALKRRLNETRTTCALFDTAAMVRHLEWAYTRIWETYEAGRGAEGFQVPVLEKSA